jgi:toxin ParE1/3/4
LSRKPVIPRVAAVRDADACVDYYCSESGSAVADRFVDALEAAYDHLSRQPSSGAPRWGHLLELPGLRMWPLRGFPHLVFFMERADFVEVVRILHSRRDLPGELRGADEGE